MYQGLTLISQVPGPAVVTLDSSQGRFGRNACCATNAAGVDIGQQIFNSTSAALVSPGVRVGTLRQATWIMPNRGRGRREFYHEVQTACFIGPGLAAFGLLAIDPSVSTAAIGRFFSGTG